MYLEVILPNSFFSDIDMTHQKTRSLFVEATTLDELYDEFESKYPQFIDKLWNENGEIRKNVILVVNDNLISKSEYDYLKFPDHAILEIMTQFAGG